MPDGPQSEPAPAGWERDLLSTVCHDLKAPLASIVMGIGFLRRVLHPDDAAALRVVDSMHRSADKMSQLIASFHDLGRLQSREMKLNLLPHDLEAVASAAFEQCASDAKAQGVAVSPAQGPGLAGAILQCDRERLLQSLRILTSCALRVLPEGGRFALHASTTPTEEVRFQLEAERGGASRGIAAELPKPELALGTGLIELHGARGGDGRPAAGRDRRGPSTATACFRPDPMSRVHP
jgi:signal transduction histidine kinase